LFAIDDVSSEIELEGKSVKLILSVVAKSIAAVNFAIADVVAGKCNVMAEIWDAVMEICGGVMWTWDVVKEWVFSEMAVSVVLLNGVMIVASIVFITVFDDCVGLLVMVLEIVVMGETFEKLGGVSCVVFDFSVLVSSVVIVVDVVGIKVFCIVR
jgi:hypothetical protein